MGKRGRPPIGPRIHITLPQNLIDTLDHHANGNRALLIRRILTTWSNNPKDTQ